ncbi:hypothetical protein BDQ94DRAFT_164007 [Aspergillus welwitschiae]|uniref:Uncharacterized protein n=1 Tax=Aspergillus welwitschiae TaxID=1341132 RepID=A0A3F3PJ84_9EURO|nr:hypothetical protein BDQ94DRAFT_164007 [Aspergillus welwitschiae]RDH27004.1 hypothetical protein BDQ94DRAFT_164007 [Aspergillus welwitschiae]
MADHNVTGNSINYSSSISPPVPHPPFQPASQAWGSPGSKHPPHDISALVAGFLGPFLAGLEATTGGLAANGGDVALFTLVRNWPPLRAIFWTPFVGAVGGVSGVAGAEVRSPFDGCIVACVVWSI